MQIQTKSLDPYYRILDITLLMSKTKILKGIASLFKSRGKDVSEGTVQPSKVFMNNLVETFGEKEVQEGVRIINNKYKRKKVINTI